LSQDRSPTLETINGYLAYAVDYQATEMRDRKRNNIAIMAWRGRCYFTQRSVQHWRIHGRDRDDVPPVIQKSPPTFLTHKDAIAGFTSQSIGLPAYACKTDSSATIKLAPRMHKKLAICQYKRPTATYPMRNFYQIFNFCGSMC